MTRSTTFPIAPGWRPLLKDMGLHVERVLRRAGLPEDLLSRPGSTLTTAEYFRLWQSLEAEAGDPLFPLRVMQAIQAESFDPPLFAALCSANMLQAAQRLATYKKLIAPMRLDVVVDRHGELSLSPHWLEAQGEVPFSVQVAELAFLLRLVRLATRHPVQATKVKLPRLPMPPQMKAFTEFFSVAPRHGEVACLTLAAADARRPFLTANESMWRVFEPDLRKRLGELDAAATIAQRVRSVLLELLPGGRSGIEAVAERLALSTRTLQRRLGEEGDNFRALVNRTREELARHYLAHTKLSGSEIGFLLGFEDPNSFYRAFQEWTGQTPEALRTTLP